MKKLLSLFISCVMLFNLTADIFAAPQLASKEQRNQISNTLNDAYLESLENNPQTQNKNICESFTKSKEEYQKTYEKTLKTFTEIAKEYNDLGELFKGALKSKETEESLIDEVNYGLEHYQKEIDEYNALNSLYWQKIEELGGMDTIEQEYDLYQNWLALKDEMEENKKQQEEILSTSKAALEKLPKHSVKKAVKEEKNTLIANISDAEKKLQDYQENYFSYQNRFDTFAAEFNSLGNWENELKNTEDVVIDPLNNLINDIENGKREKQHYLEEFSLDQDFDKDSDWNDIFKSIQTIVDKKERELKQAKAAFKSAETNLYSKEACDFQRRMESALKDAEEKFCNDVKDHYDAPIEIKEDPFIAWIYSDSEIRKLPTKWKRTKDVYKACVNPVWGDRQLRGYASNITLSDMSDYKYGEYLLKYPLQEGKTLSLKEEEEIGQKLAQKVRDMVLVDVDKAIKMHYNIIGDRHQAIILYKQLEEDWQNLGGEVSSNVQEDSGFFVNNVKLSATTNQLIAKKPYYSYKHKVFFQVNNIGRFYTREIKGFMTGFIAQIAHDKSTENIGLLSSVKELGVSEEDINKAFYDLTWSFSQQEIEQETDKYVASIQKRPFKPAMFLIAPYSTIVDRNREVVRKRRNARTGVKLDTSEYLQNILLFNAHLQDQDRENRDEGNLTAWNNLAEAAYYRKAYYLLNDMVKLGYSMGRTYLEKPLYYSNEIEKSLHEYAQDTLIDICIGIAISQFISIGKAMIKTSLKATINSSMRKGIAMTMKRDLALLNKNVKSESINILNRTAGKDFKFIDKSALKYSQRDMSQIKKFRLKTPIGQTSHTLGRELGANNAFVNKNIKNIKTKYTRPSAAQNSKVFNREFTEKQYKQLSNDLKDFYKQPRPKPSRVNISAKNVSQETANISPALNETSAANKSALSPMQKILNFNKELKNKVAASIISLSLIFNPVSYKNLFAQIGKTFENKVVKTELVEQTGKKAVGKDLTIEVKQETKQIAKNEADNAWIVDRPNSSPLIPEDKKAILPEKPNTKGGIGPKPKAKSDIYNLSSDNPAAAKGANNAKPSTLKGEKLSSNQINKATPATRNPINDRAPPVTSNKNAAGFNYQNPNNNPKVSVAPKKGAEINNLVKEKDGKISLNYTKEQEDALIKQSGDLKDKIAEGGRNLNVEADTRNLYRQEDSSGRIFQTEQESKNAGQAAKQYGDSEMVLAEKSNLVNGSDVYLYPGMKGMEFRATVKKLLANMSDLPKYFSGGKYLHTHGLSELGKYIQKIFTGDVLAVIQKTEREWLIVYEKTADGKYVIGIIQENPNRGVNLLVTNYKVECTLEGLGEQFLNVEKVGPNNTMRKVVGTKQNNMVYLNEKGGKQFTKDVNKIFENVHIGDTYTGWTP